MECIVKVSQAIFEAHHRLEA